jgi:hypothetical protein
MYKHVLVTITALFFTVMAQGQHYLFYLHGRIVEDQGANAVDKNNGFGAYEYDNIVAAFKKEGFTVISEVRAKNTDVAQYASKIKFQVDSLLKKGVKAGNITVLGSSKGSAIAMKASSIIKNANINYVFMSACAEAENTDIDFCGNILSIYEKSDTWAQSCAANKKHSKAQIPHYKELALNTGKRHGYLYKPLAEWVKPATAWGMGKYN